METLIEREDLGICPVCGQGHVVKTPYGYNCDNHTHFGEHNGRCPFHLHLHFKGISITDALVREIITTGHTGYMEMQSNRGLPYNARLVAKKDVGVVIETEHKKMSVRCPKCGGEMYVVRNGYACSNRLGDHPSCDFFIPNYFCRRFITIGEATDYINGTPGILDGFISNNGKTFSGYLAEKDGQRVIESTVGKCPVCGGNIYVGVTAFNCSNYTSDGKGCNFMFYRHIHGHQITLKEARDICRYGHTLQPFESYDLEGHILYVDLKVNVEKSRVEIVKSMGNKTQNSK